MFFTRLTTICRLVVGVSLLGTSALFTHWAPAAQPERGQPLARAGLPPESAEEPKADDPKEKADDQEQQAADAQNVNNLKILGLAMHNYHSDHGKFPPAALYSKDGKPLLSWRVLLLPYLDQQKLFAQFKLDEPWDGPTNKELLAKMPEIYAVPRGKAKGTPKTAYQVFTGAETIFPSPKACRVQEITDGTSNTILVVEAANAVSWTKPADLPYDAKKPLPKLGGTTKKGFRVTMADGSVHFLKATIKEAVLRALITRNGGEVIDANDL